MLSHSRVSRGRAHVCCLELDDRHSGWVPPSLFLFFFQAEDGIRDLVRSRGLGDVYKRQAVGALMTTTSRFSGGRLEVLVAARRSESTQVSLDLSLIHI